ncbi:MAG TPA: class I SAM-dependent methyltransferase [Prolixibacteraceae bacterium]|jgi:SAM-dependent methyltransferase|nr:class I SAM-dependent methyltransferase [Prolixibacteraceae bacterium]
MNKGQISNVLRQLGLIYLTDWIRFYIQRYKNRKINRDFKSSHPEVKLPPDYLMYESFQINYKEYYTESIDTAQWITEYFKKHIELKDKKILDWGCGPGRVIRHLPTVIGNGCEYFGTDYNRQSIDWCSMNLPGITFNGNSLEAKLPYGDNYFDVIYGISIFTHLSEQMHHDWYNELFRVLSSGGILYLTTQGDNFKVKLTEPELLKYNNGHLVIRGNVKEGHRTYSAFHPTEYMNRLFSNVEMLEHVATKPVAETWLPQDIWIIRKK